MPKVIEPLTETRCRRAKFDPGGGNRLRDGLGLYLEVAPTGSKLWRLKYRFDGKEKLLALGQYPETGLAAAREARLEARKLLAQGIDPGVRRKELREGRLQAAADTFEAIAREWLAVRKPGWTDKQFSKEESRLENHAFPWIGRTPVREIGVAGIRPLLDRVRLRGHLEQAHRLRFQLSRVFQYAVATERADRDPAADLKAVLPTRTKQNYPSITDATQVGKLLAAIDGFGGTFAVHCALRLAPLLFVRPGELRAAEWAELELDHADGPQWVIHPSRRKLRKAAKEDPRTPPHIVPLSTQAVAIIEDLRPLTGRRQHLFPGVRDPKRPISDNTINAALRSIGYDKETMVGHGFRHMASTLLNEQGFNKDAIERQLSHKEPGVAGVYNKAEHLPERRRMMQQWANYLDELKAAHLERFDGPS